MTVSDEDIHDYLEHFGIKGMRWGSRKSTRSGLTSNLTRKQKIGLAAIGGGVGILGARFMMGRSLNVPVSLAFGGATAYAGASFAKRMLEKNGGTSLNKTGR